MKGFDVLHVKSAVKSHNKFDLSRTHLTTMDFGQIIPLLSEETVPGDKFHIKGDYFSRLAPLVKPTYGKFGFKTVAGFVPYHQIAFDSDAWLAGKTTFEGVTPIQRCITVSDLHNFIYLHCTTNTGATASNSQYTFVQSDGSLRYTLFTNIGRYWINILNSLGYALPQNVNLQTTSVWYTSISIIKLSAFPLLAFFKLYNDYMSQSQRFNTSALSSFLLNVKYNKTQTGYNTSTGVIAAAGMKIMFDNLKLNYDSDYFTTAWATPNNSIAGSESINNINVPSLAGSYHEQVLHTFDDNRLITDTDTVGGRTVSVLGQRALDFLKSFDDWVRRNNYSGSRAVQQVYSRFGIKTDDYKSHYAQVLSTDLMPVQVGDVTSTADTSVVLGDYAGKGIMSGNKDINIQVSDYGIILILGYFTVIPMNAYGFDRKVLRNSPLDYYNPEFDGIGAEAISIGEYFENPIEDPSTDSTKMDDVFGFTERYNSYRFGRDQITGEFRDYRNTGAMNCWHTGRNLGTIRHGGALVAQSSAVNCLPQSDSEYNRIFSVTNGNVDHFYLTARYVVDAVRPMLSLNQVPKLGEGDTAVPRNGNVIS